MLRLLIASLALLPMAVSAESASDEAIPVHVPTDGCAGLGVGSRLVYRLREEVRKTPAMKLVEEYSDSLLAARVTCLETDDADIVAHYATVITLYNGRGYYDYLISGSVGSCGSRNVDGCALSLMANLDQALSDAKRRARAGEIHVEP